MIIEAISDTHLKQDELILSGADVLVIAGDFTLRGTIPEIIKFSEWLVKQQPNYKSIIIIAGNHDFLFQTDPLLAQSFLPGGVIYLENSGVEIEGINFWGSPQSLRFGNWAFMEDEYTLSGIYDIIPNNTNVLITHGPPYSILDTTKTQVLAGSRALYERVIGMDNLKIHIFGHIHEGHGFLRIEETDFYNVS